MKRNPGERGGRRRRETAGSPPPTARTPAPPTFSVPPRIRHLQAEQLAALTESFRAWYARSPRPADRNARGRIWLAYLAIRYTGAKLGEVLAIDERTDLDLPHGVVTLGTGRNGQGRRRVHLPADAVRAMRSHLEDPATRSAPGRIFRLDQGFVRRKFYERADACGIPRRLASPEVLRASRAIELLRGNVPLPVVQRILGQGTAGLTARWLDYRPDDVRRILEAYVLADLHSRTSARNLFAGRVAHIIRGELLSEIALRTPDGHRVVSVITNTSLDNLGLRQGLPVTALIKAPSVMVARSAVPPQTSARNVLRGRISAVRDDGIMAELILRLRGGTEVCALITADSVRRLKLTAGDDACAVFDTSAVVLSVAPTGSGPVGPDPRGR
ncbi:MAG: TOBE domain-containing protein [Deltaproteobacteria bacterium]|nr:TOBE domain-containing protein [Deltaproteobacteria bacterium]